MGFCFRAESDNTLEDEKVQSKQIELVTRYDPKAPHRVIGDPGRIQQVVTNLSNNAIKFTARGHVFINVETLNLRRKWS